MSPKLEAYFAQQDLLVGGRASTAPRASRPEPLAERSAAATGPAGLAASDGKPMPAQTGQTSQRQKVDAAAAYGLSEAEWQALREVGDALEAVAWFCKLVQSDQQPTNSRLPMYVSVALRQLAAQGTPFARTLADNINRRFKAEAAVLD